MKDMKHFEVEFKGVKDLKIYYQAWVPDTPKAVIQLVHGGFEHSGRYQNVVKELIPHDYAVYADDHRGHGKSEGLRNYVEKFDQFIEDEKSPKKLNTVKSRDKKADAAVSFQFSEETKRILSLSEKQTLAALFTHTDGKVTRTYEASGRSVNMEVMIGKKIDIRG